jgi:peptidoglycan/xylan/chitin deacetylase (PgdA/CDA1 family)
VFDGVPVRAEIYSYAASRVGGMSVLVDRFLARCPEDMRAQLDSPAFVHYERGLRDAAPWYSTRDFQFRFLRNNPANAGRFEEIMDGIVEESGIRVADVARTLWIDADAVRTLAGLGHRIGLHSYDHPYAIGTLPRREQQRQYARNYEQLAAITAAPPRCMSHPLNSYNDDSLDVLNDLGITCGFRATVIPPPGKAINPSRLEMAREDSTHLLDIANEAQ